MTQVTGTRRTAQPAKILALDSDALLTILQYCIPPDYVIEVPPSTKNPHLILGQICYTFRWLLHNTPSFWTKFSIQGNESGQHRDLSRQWLHRVEELGSPLPISLENTDENHFSSPHLKEFALVQSERLSRLHLYLTYDGLECLLTSLPHLTFPRLTEFWALCPETQEASLLTVKPIFKASPLEQFTLIVGPLVLARGLGIQWGKLKVLRLTTLVARFYFPISWIHTILDACQESLETCSISLEPTTDPTLRRIELPKLKNLTIHFRDPGWKTQAGILNFLVLPALEFLDVSGNEGLAFNEASTALKSFFIRSSNIQQLYFDRVPVTGVGQGQFSTNVDSQELKRILTLLPNLKLVHFPKGYHTNIMLVLEAIFQGSICPLLEKIELTVHNGLHILKAILALCDATSSSPRVLKVIKLADPKVSWIGICEPSPVEDPEITASRQLILELDHKGLKIET